MFEEEFGADHGARADEIFKEIVARGMTVIMMMVISDVNNFEVLKRYLYFKVRQTGMTMAAFTTACNEMIQITTSDKVKGKRM